MSGPDARNPLLVGLRRPVPRPVRLRGASGLALVFGELPAVTSPRAQPSLTVQRTA